MTDDRIDRELAARLRAYESRLPDQPAPAPGSGLPGRSGLPVLLVGGTAAVAAVVLALAMVQGWGREQIGAPDRSATPSTIPSFTTSPGSSVEPTEATEGTPSATAAPSAEPSRRAGLRGGVSWTRLAQLQVDGEDLSAGGLASRDGLMVLVGTALLSNEKEPDMPIPRQGRVWLSTDGVSWDQVANAETFRDAVLEAVLVTIDGTFVVLGWLDPVSGPTIQHVAWESVDGRQWERVDLGLPGDLHPTQRTVAQGPAGFVIAWGHEVWHSPDGRNWSLVREFPSVEDADSRDIQQVRGGPEGFVATGGRGDGRIYIMASGDGIEWFDAPEQASIDSMPHVPPLAPLGRDWIASGRGGVDPIEIWHSANGLDWAPVKGVTPVGAGLDVSAELLGVGGRIFLEAQDTFAPPGPTWTSVDGRTWTMTDLHAEVLPAIATIWGSEYLLIGTESQDGLRSITVWSSPGE